MESDNEKVIGLYLDDKLISNLAVTKETTIRDLVAYSRKLVQESFVQANSYNVYLVLSSDNKNTKEISASVLQDPKYQNISPYDQLTDTSYLVYSKILTGDKNLDTQILTFLDDRSLFNICIINKYAKSLCNNEMFWKNRFLTKYGQNILDDTWKNSYLKIVKETSKYAENPWKFFDLMSMTMEDMIPAYVEKDKLVNMENAPEKIRILYNYLDLGKNITITYPIDRYQELPYVVRSYEGNFMPAKVFELLEKFYGEPITVEEFEQQVEVDNPYALEDWTVEDVTDGSVTRGDMLGPLFFEGFGNLGYYHVIHFGS